MQTRLTKIVILILVSIMLENGVLFFGGCSSAEPRAEDFLLNVTYDDCVEVGVPISFHCELSVPKKLRVSHGSQIISYVVDGTSEWTTSEQHIENFSKGQVIERNIDVLFTEEGEHTVNIFCKFDVVGKKGNSEYLIEKEVNINI